MPTVEARKGIRETTIRQWRDFGWEPLVFEQAPPYGHRYQRDNARKALTAALKTPAEFIILSEDDIDLDPRIPDLLHSFIGEYPCSLWHMPRFEPARAALPGNVIVTKAIAQKHWHGALCVFFTRKQAEHILTVDVGYGGIDMDMRDPGVRITIPSLVHHRELPRIATTRGPKYVGETDFEGDVTDVN